MQLIASNYTADYLKGVGMACWILANGSSTRRKIASAGRYEVPAGPGGAPFEIAVGQGELLAVLHLYADIGVTRVQRGQALTNSDLKPKAIVRFNLRPRQQDLFVG
jgi:hypothetical protein